MSSRVVFSVVAVAVLTIATNAGAVVPTSINVQGRLTDSTGTPLPAGVKGISFRIFDEEAGGTQIWPAVGAESQIITSSSEGLWTAYLGAIIPLTDSVFADTSRWLEININDGVNPAATLPRVPLVTGPYAFRVATVDGTSGGNITSKLSVGPGHGGTGVATFIAGENNNADGDDATIGGGTGNDASGLSSVVGGGDNNAAQFLQSTVGGGDGNTAGAITATVGGGLNNQATGVSSSVLGGEDNLAGDAHAAVGGGLRNTADGAISAIAGGSDNHAGALNATVGGGALNKATGIASTVSGGVENHAESNHATVSGGNFNTAGGAFATVPGGSYNEASSDHSYAAGYRAKSLHEGTFVWADSTDEDFTSTGANQFLVRATGGVGINTDAPASMFEVGGSTATSVRTVGTDVTLDDYDSAVLTSAGVTITLPPAADCPGRMYYIKRMQTTGTVNISTTLAALDNIDGVVSRSITVQYGSLTIISDGNHTWCVID